MTAKFLRRGWERYSKTGRRRKKKQVWRRPHGRDNKMREKRGGYGPVVSIGYRTQKDSRGKIDNKMVVMINNLNDLSRLKSGEIAILGKIGKKKKLEIAKKARERNIHIHNLNVNKFLDMQKPKIQGTK
ncbi:MAG: eL32 family ribosomal protein [Candidatus Nanoarchaeia archaeon]|nr:eL32 family ribosomal protein [Candidatus Nanoarchaeia archaeon]